MQNRFHARFALARGDSRIDVELHWDIMPEDFPFHSDLKGIWKRCGSLSFGGANVTTLSPEDLLLFLCVHGSRHLWLRLQWLCDVGATGETPCDNELGPSRGTGKDRRRTAHVVSGDFSCQRHSWCAPAARDRARGRRDSHTVELANQVRWRLFEGPLFLFKPWKGVHFRLQLMDRAWDHLSYSPRCWPYPNDSHTGGVEQSTAARYSLPFILRAPTYAVGWKVWGDGSELYLQSV